jgi:hypothetical protein
LYTSTTSKQRHGTGKLSFHEQDFRGRIGLHSLPAAEEFYGTVCGMTDLGRDESYQGLRYFEMTAAQAAAFSR